MSLPHRKRRGKERRGKKRQRGNEKGAERLLPNELHVGKKKKNWPDMLLKKKEKDLSKKRKESPRHPTLIWIRGFSAFT